MSLLDLLIALEDAGINEVWATKSRKSIICKPQSAVMALSDDLKREIYAHREELTAKLRVFRPEIQAEPEGVQ